MNAAQRIIKALAFTGIPVSRIRYDGEEETYFVFLLDSYPADFANDQPQHELTEVELHLFAPFSLNTRALRKQVRKALTDAGFTHPIVRDFSQAARKSDGAGQHVLFECEIAEGVDDV